MNILLFAQSLKNSAGIERMATSLANEIVLYHNVEIVVCGSSTNSFYVLNEKIAVHALNADFSQKFKAIYEFNRIIKKLNPDIVINVSIPMGQISIPALISQRKSIPIIAWEHFHLHAGSLWGLFFRLISAACCLKTVVLTNDDKSKYPKFLQKKVECIYNFTTKSSQVLEDKVKDNVVLAVGRLTPQKGYDLLLPIWGKVTSVINNWKLLIIGDGYMEDVLKKMILDLGISKSVELIHSTPDIVKYYQNSKIFVMTSRFEGLPMVLLEAKLSGLPIISYDCPYGPSEIIRNDVDGYVVPMGNATEFITKLIRLMRDAGLRGNFSKQAQNDIRTRFGIQKIISQWNDLFASIKMSKC